MSDLEKLRAAVIEGDWKAAAAATRAALAAGVAPLEVATGCLIPAMNEVGRRFECEEYFVPDMLLSARAMKAAMEILRPLLAAAGAQPVGRVVIGTVKGDLHDIGKNLVAAMLEGGGFEVIDLGADVSPERFIEAVRQSNARVGGALGAAHRDHAFDEDHHRSIPRRGIARQSEDHGGRRASHTAVRRRDWRRRLQRKRGKRGGPGAPVDRRTTLVRQASRPLQLTAASKSDTSRRAGYR